ncbi:hypothetical protein [Acrocarpospora catenulata]|uniref:hypothetical protein n=1 Tax=Acrocarpospora catenulata TaxID=2836182 RepID=UPI001BDA2AE6|nr:hypothetical protein [Acrocarpospora catenulata]
MRIFVIAGAMAMLAACGTVRGTDTATMGDFTARAQEVAERWEGSPEERGWRAGFVPLETLALGTDWRKAPKWAPVSELNSVWKLEMDLSAAQPAPAVLNWEDGSTLTVPVVSARAAYDRMSKPRAFVDEKCPAAGCRPLRVIGATMGEATVASSRGPVRVPTWDFRVEGVPGPFRRVAVDPSAISAPPQWRKGEMQEAFTYETVTPDELELRYGHGTCDTTHGARVYETSGVVVVDVDVRPEDVTVCNAMMRIDQIKVKLGGALGDRVVLDSSSGLPLLRGEVGIHLAQGFPHFDPRQT